ncbi:MAG TPA: protein kinase [Candidatus Limnocylindrales bacterium]|nr:protein kinase [Candidatus Limnocylindrales bacterium]
MTPDILTRLKSAFSGRYDVKRELARGGMGQVFEARDQKHGRAIAIKVLDPDLAAAIGPARFRAEIETAARLSHPHIVPLFDSGEADGLLYYVMPLLAGESLRGRLQRERQLPIEDAIRIAREVSDALRYAHEQGLVHRDVKPENIILSGGHALVLDFGIARTSDAVPTPETHTVAAVGTPAYMSPEQTSGGSLDGRADQYALACVVYEMVTGQPPFTGSTGDSVLLQHRTVDARPATALRPTTPAYVAHALTRALAKAPADRFPTMSAFSDAISSALTPPGRGTPGGGEAGRLMLAVLPLENRSADAEQEYFTDGMTEELITHLGRLQPKRLGVIARTSAMRYKKTAKSIEEIGRELGVEYVVEGSVRRAGDRIRITTQLIQVADQSHLWAETYDRRVADVFDVQDEVASAVAKALEVELVSAGAKDVSQPEPSSSEAYEAYLKGRFHWNKRTPEALRLAIKWFERAIEIDPEFARAYAGLADVYNVQVTYMQVSADEAYPKGERAARRAVELAPELAEVRTSLASMLTHMMLPAEAKLEYDRALEIDPNYVPALYWGAVQEAARGSFDEALAMVRRARQLDPLSVTIEIVHANILWFTRRGPEAIDHYRRALELEPKMPWVHLRLALCLAALGRLEEALQGMEGQEPSLSRTLEMTAVRAYVLGRLGRRDEARAEIAELERRSTREYVSWELFTYAYLGIDDRESLLRVLTVAPKKGIIGRLLLAHDVSFDHLREDPRFREVLPTPTSL